MNNNNYWASIGLWLPAAVLAVLYPCFLGYLAYSLRQLPHRAATHFNFRGRPNGYMNRVLYVVIILLLGLGLPLSVVVTALLAKSGGSGLHIAHREYWLAPGRIEQTYLYLVGHSLWFACLAVSFIAGLHFLIVRANQTAPPRLSMWMLLIWLGCFAGGVLAWERTQARHFSHPWESGPEQKVQLLFS